MPIPAPIVVLQDECPYFKDGRPSRTAFLYPDRPLEPPEFEAAIQLGMRRSGFLLYRPVCPNCRKCQPFRVPISTFEISKSQKRVWKQCTGKFEIALSRPNTEPDRLELYRLYGEFQHGQGDASESRYAEFLVDSCADTYELSWRDKTTGKLIAISIVDILPTGLSSVYSYWDPDLKDLSLGTYTALCEIDLCRRNGLPYYYLGFLVPGAPTMNYKAKFGPAEVWDGNNWIPTPSRDTADPAMAKVLNQAEQSSILADAQNFPA